MRFVRFHPGDRLGPTGGTPRPPRPVDAAAPRPDQPAVPAPAPLCGEGPRLNLLVSWAGWQTDSVADRLPAVLEPMGIRSLRARSGREAERVIRTEPVHIAIVDLGLPLHDRPSSGGSGDEAGPRLLELLRRLDTHPPTVVVKSSVTRRDDFRHLAAALRSDAFAVVERAAADLELMLRILQRCLSRHYADRWPGGPPPMHT